MSAEGAFGFGIPPNTCHRIPTKGTNKPTSHHRQRPRIQLPKVVRTISAQGDRVGRRERPLAQQDGNRHYI